MTIQGMSCGHRYDVQGPHKFAKGEFTCHGEAASTTTKPMAQGGGSVDTLCGRCGTSIGDEFAENNRCHQPC